MNILILGAGRVGESVAESLVSENNDITVIDTDPTRLSALQERLDLRTVVGNGIQPSVLEAAGADDADMLIACAPDDETNLVACKVARDLYNVSTTIARLRSEEFQTGQPLLERSGFGVDRVISPETSVTRTIRKLVEYPRALQVIEFGGGAVNMVAVRAFEGAPIVGRTIGELPDLAPGTQVRFVSIYRRVMSGPDRHIACDGDTRVHAGDEVFLVAPTADVPKVLDVLRQRQAPVRRVMIAGGGRIGLRLARDLAPDYQLKVIEPDLKRCEYLVTQLPSDVLVLQGDATDEDLLGDENVHECDLFIAVTSDDEDNIMSCLLAKRMGAERVLALINRRAYADLVQGTQIDIAISPSQAILGELLAHLRRGDVTAVHSLRHGAAEVIEAVARGDQKTSKVVGRRIDELALPRGTQIGAIVRAKPGSDDSSEVIVPHHDTVIHADDQLVVFVPDKRTVRAVEKLFQVGATFF